MVASASSSTLPEPIMLQSKPMAWPKTCQSGLSGYLLCLLAGFRPVLAAAHLPSRIARHRALLARQASAQCSRKPFLSNQKRLLRRGGVGGRVPWACHPAIWRGLVALGFAARYQMRPNALAGLTMASPGLQPNACQNSGMCMSDPMVRYWLGACESVRISRRRASGRMFRRQSRA